MRILKYLILFSVCAVTVWYCAAQKNEFQVVSGQVFGTFYNIKVKAGHENRLLQREVKEELAKVNAEMSVFEMSSEISEINRQPAGKWIDLSPEMSLLLKNAYEIYTMSNGAFDPTTARLIDLWGFGTKGAIQKLPSEEEIKEILKTTGFNKIQFSNNFKRLRKKYDETTLNLSAIAKGYGVDRLSALLKKSGYNNYVVEVGGEVVASGAKSDAVNGWNIGIATPTNEGNENSFVVTLKDYAVATSGDYRNFFFIDDKQYSHTINPLTGYPVEHNLVSVTVFHKNCMMADGLATAIIAMGEEKAKGFIAQNNLAAVMFVKDEDKNIVPIISDAAQKLGIK